MLRGIDLKVREHEAVALIGASGSGKSTLLRCIDLLEDIDDGDVFLDGEVITDPSWTRSACGAGSGSSSRPTTSSRTSTVLENVVLGQVQGAGAWRAPRPRPRAGELLERFGLGGRENDHPDQLSGGQQQRVAIARAFAARPRAMLLDEVTSALDPELVGEVLAAVRELKAEGVTMLLATHEMSFARDVADTVGFLHEGRLVELGPAAAGALRPREPETQRFLRRLLEAHRA